MKKLYLAALLILAIMVICGFTYVVTTHYAGGNAIGKIIFVGSIMLAVWIGHPLMTSIINEFRES